MDLNEIRTRKASPLEFLLAHREEIAETVGSYPAAKAYEMLCGRFEGFKEAVPMNTFKTNRIPFLAANRELEKTAAELEAIRRETEALKRENAELRERVSKQETGEPEAIRRETEALKRENAELRERISKQETGEPEAMPEKFRGWTVQQHKKGYWQAWKWIAGKTRWLYVGKQWNTPKMTAKINALESALNPE
jgi:hypothetical protein